MELIKIQAKRLVILVYCILKCPTSGKIGRPKSDFSFKLHHSRHEENLSDGARN